MKNQSLRIQLQETSNTVSDILIQNGYTADDVDKLSPEYLYKISPDIARLFDVDESIYDAFNEEETLNYFRAILKFDITYKLKKQQD